MFYFLHPFIDSFSPLRIFQYITFRMMMAAGTAFVLSLLIGPWLIGKLRMFQCVEKREDHRIGSLDRSTKVGTPTMGGLLILFSTGVATFLWAAPGNFYVLGAVSTFLFMGALGFLDDVLKLHPNGWGFLTHESARIFTNKIRLSTNNPQPTTSPKCGLSSRSKLLAQLCWTGAFLLLLRSNPDVWLRTQQLMVPFCKEPVIESMGWLGTFLFIGVVLVGTSNAVNLTDGLDGLAVGCSSTAVAAYLVMAYVAGHFVFADYLQIPFVKGGGELSVFCGALFGGCLGFLWFNAHPAQIFMGDTGSLAVGGALAAVAVLIKQELVLILVGGVFVLEALSVLIQVGGFKLTRQTTGTGRRVFHRAPLHHHFEHVAKGNKGAKSPPREGCPTSRAVATRRRKGGVGSENRIVIRFWILSLLFGLLGLAALKIR